MVSKSDPNKVSKFVCGNNYVDVYIFLITSLDNLRNRGSLLDKSIKGLQEKIQKMIQKVSAETQAIVPENLEASSMFKDIHYTELEIIQQLNILIELLGVNYHLIRTNVRDLPKCIGRKDFSPEQLHHEFDYFKGQTLTDVWNNFHYPNTVRFSELSDEENNFLKELLSRSAAKILDAFKELYQFQKNFRQVYNKYKHTLSEFTGVFGLDKVRKQVQTHIYVRHKEDDKVCTYVIPVSLDEVKYFNEIAARAYLIVQNLLDNALLHIVNEEKDFIPRTLFIEKVDEAKFKEIADKVQCCVMPSFTSKMIVRLPDQKSIEEMNKELTERHIYKMNNDILDLDSLLKEGVTFSKD